MAPGSRPSESVSAVSLARRAEFIQPGVSTPGSGVPKIDKSPQGPAESLRAAGVQDRTGLPAPTGAWDLWNLEPGVDTPGWINSALRAVRITDSETFETPPLWHPLLEGGIPAAMVAAGLAAWKGARHDLSPPPGSAPPPHTSPHCGATRRRDDQRAPASMAAPTQRHRSAIRGKGFREPDLEESRQLHRPLRQPRRHHDTASFSDHCRRRPASLRELKTGRGSCPLAPHLFSAGQQIPVPFTGHTAPRSDPLFATPSCLSTLSGCSDGRRSP